MTTAYGPGRPAAVHPLRDADVVALALCTVLAAWLAAPGGHRVVVVGAAAIVVASVGAVRHSVGVGVLVAVVLAGAGWRSGHEWDRVAPERLGPYRGWATLVTDPTPVSGAHAVVIEVEGERFQVHARGSPGRRIARFEAGDVVMIAGERTALGGAHPRRAQVRHVVGRLHLDAVGDEGPSAPVARASNRLRALLRGGADAVLAADAPLFAGLVIGDDSRQDPALVDAFRAAGLSHLTAVSGQNVAFVLAITGVLLRRLPRWWRLGATAAVIGWFALLTRLEPSVLRASTMALLAAVSFAVGAPRSAVRLLGVSVAVLVLVDPFLVWSVGFWLSTGATFGVTAVAPVLERRLGGPAWLVAPLSVTVGAQLGVLVPSWLVFRRVPALGLAANLLAVPVAGAVMLVGIPAALLAAVTPEPLASVVMALPALGTRWVSVVAQLAARCEPTGAPAVALWCAQISALSAMWWRSDRRGTATDV